MSEARTAILYAPGTNCHEETAAAIELAGGKAELVLLTDLIGGRNRLDDFQAAMVPAASLTATTWGREGFLPPCWLRACVTSWCVSSDRRNPCWESATVIRC